MKKTPQRMCVACREMKNKTELMRCRVTPEGMVEIDPTGKKSGRGAYICLNAACIAKAKKANLLSRALEATADESVYSALENYEQN